jgi:hypothetical protein
MTQITTSDQLTDDRVIFKAPANKYAHVIGKSKHPSFSSALTSVGTPNFAGYSGDPGYSWLPFKLVDPTGAALPAGVYNFVWTYWWATGGPPQLDYMVPAYSTGFDIEISADAEDAGFLTEAVNANPNYDVTLIGNSSSPGSLDKTSPWPPYAVGYLDNNYDGTDPSTPDGKRTFAPYWQKHIDATAMSAPSLQTIGSIKDWTEDQRQAVLPLPPGSDFATWPAGNQDVGNMTAGTGDGGMPAPVVDAVGLSGSSNDTTVPLDTGAGNGTTPVYAAASNETMPVDTAASNQTMPSGGSYNNGTETRARVGAGAGAGGSVCYLPPVTLGPKSNVTVSAESAPGSGYEAGPAGNHTAPASTEPGPAGNGTAGSDMCHWVSDDGKNSLLSVPFAQCRWVSHKKNSSISADTMPSSGNGTDECRWVSHKKNPSISADTIPSSGNGTHVCHWISDEKNSSISTPANECTWISDEKNTTISAASEPGPSNETSPAGTSPNAFAHIITGNTTAAPSGNCTWVADALSEKKTTTGDDTMPSSGSTTAPPSDSCKWFVDTSIETNTTKAAAAGPQPPSNSCKWVADTPTEQNTTEEAAPGSQLPHDSGHSMPSGANSSKIYRPRDLTPRDFSPF